MAAARFRFGRASRAPVRLDIVSSQKRGPRAASTVAAQSGVNGKAPASAADDAGASSPRKQASSNATARRKWRRSGEVDEVMVALVRVYTASLMRSAAL